MFKQYAAIATSILLLGLIGIYLQDCPNFTKSKLALQSQEVPGNLLNYGVFGSILKDIGAVRVVAGDIKGSSAPDEQEESSHANIFQKKRKHSNYLFAANPEFSDGFQSAESVSREHFKKNWPLISVAVDSGDLYSRKTGIIRNWKGRGKGWERLAYISFFEDGELKFSTGAGIRLHGDSTRPGKKLGSLSLGKSFRLHFRREYGLSKVDAKTVFQQGGLPIKRLVISTDRGDPRFINLMALKISERIGCLTPLIRPVIFVLNGESQGIRFLVEHQGEKQLTARLGHKDFIFFRYKSTNEPETERLYKELNNWVRRTPRITKAMAESRVDLDNVSRWIISIVYCGTEDFNQGVAIIDQRSSQPKWYWINWDMDHSFRRMNGDKGTSELWQKPAFSLTGRSKSNRMLLFRRLMRECPDYRKYFTRLLTDISNHRLTDEFLKGLVVYYKKMANDFSSEKAYFNHDAYQEFFQKRHMVLRREMQTRFNAGNYYKCDVKGSDGVRYRIDNKAIYSEYSGWYFEGQTAVIEIEKEKALQFSHWLINGKPSLERVLTLNVESDVIVQPVFKSEN